MWIDIPDKLFSGLDIWKNNIQNEWSWISYIVDLLKYLLDKIGWAIILFIIQKQYEKRKLSFQPIRCTLLSSKPVKYDSHLYQLPSNRKLEIGFGRYYYHFRLQLKADNNSYCNISLKGLGAKKIQLDNLGDGNNSIEVDLKVFWGLRKISWIFPIGLTICFQDNTNMKYVEKILLINKSGTYSINIKSLKKCS